MAEVGASWGRHPRVAQVVLPLHAAAAPLPAFDGSALPYGNGRSYGDSCLNPGGTLLHARGLDRFVAFDRDTGVLTCEAGVLLSEILALVVPHGWFLPVTPGTQLVTVGGAIANDVHGKNHRSAGGFGDHVRAFELLRSDGTRRTCVPGDPWFAATVGGLGLTGVVVHATLQLRRIAGPWLDTERRRFFALADYFRLVGDSADWEYTVAWIDCLAGGDALGRGLFHRGVHAPDAGAPAPAPKRRPGLPLTPPVSLVNGLSLRAFNALHWRRGADTVAAREHYTPFFHPLDGIADWNRMYGPRGFLQYQCVVPPAVAPEAVADLLRAISAAGIGSFLAVLKPFGARAPVGMLSFPRAGTTLALDFPNGGAALPALLERLDAIVAEAGGAIYPAKDARWPGHRFRAAYPRWQEFSTYVDPKFSSGFWRRAME